jgi:hypothetical protein
MRNLFARRPSPSLVVAFVALLAAVGGTAAALPGKNTIDSGDIRKGAVKRSEIARNAVNGRKVAKNSITGRHIKEGTLGKVRRAETANVAGSVGGVTFRPFRYANDGTGDPTPILDFGGLTITASCAFDVLSLTAGSNVADAELGGYTVEASREPADPSQRPQNVAYDNDFDPGDTVNLVPDDEDEEVGELRYSKRDGSSVSVQFHIYGGNDGAGADAGRCAVSGVALSF